MRKLLTATALLIACHAHAAPASQESIEKLFAVMKTDSIMDGMFGSIEQMMRQTLQQSVHGKAVSAEQRRFLDAVPAKFVAVMREELDGAKLKAMHVQIYRDTFEQEEIDGLTAFYASPVGQAFVSKTPLVMQKTLVLMQGTMQSLLPKIQAAVKEAVAEAKIVTN